MEYVRCYIRSEIGRDVKKENYDNLKQMGRLQWLALQRLREERLRVDRQRHRFHGMCAMACLLQTIVCRSSLRRIWRPAASILL